MDKKEGYVMTVGDRIKSLRNEAGYTRVELAEKLGMPQTTLRNYENNAREPGHDFLIKIAKEFNVTTDYLLGLSEKTNATIENYDGKYLINLLTNKLGRKPTVKEMKLLSAIFDGICEYINPDAD